MTWTLRLSSMQKTETTEKCVHIYIYYIMREWLCWISGTVLSVSHTRGSRKKIATYIYETVNAYTDAGQKKLPRPPGNSMRLIETEFIRGYMRAELFYILLRIMLRNNCSWKIICYSSCAAQVADTQSGWFSHCTDNRYGLKCVPKFQICEMVICRSWFRHHSIEYKRKSPIMLMKKCISHFIQLIAHMCQDFIICEFQ